LSGAISGSVKFKMVADGHLGMTALLRVTLASAGLSCLFLEAYSIIAACVLR